MIVGFLCCCQGFTSVAQDPITLLIKQGVVKVIKAVDLKIQRMQNETLWLQHAQKALENTLSKTRLDEIAGWVEKQRDLYREYYDELWRVKSALAFYHRIKELTRKQVQVVQAYKNAWAGVRKDGHFTPEEIAYIGNVYLGILKQSLSNLEQVQLVMQSFSLEMSDAQRLQMIDVVADDIQENYNDLNAFNTRNIQISLNRSKDDVEVAVIKSIYGLK
jgi:hypothetical protein